MPDCNRDVAEDAAAHALVGDRMVARRTYEGVRVVDDPLDDGVDGRDAGPGREQRDLVARAVHERVVARVSASSVAELSNELHVGGGVHAGHLLDAGRRRPEAVEMLPQAADFDEAVDPSDPIGRLGVRPRFHHSSGGHHGCRRTRVMPQEPLVVDERGSARPRAHIIPNGVRRQASTSAAPARPGLPVSVNISRSGVGWIRAFDKDIGFRVARVESQATCACCQPILGALTSEGAASIDLSCAYVKDNRLGASRPDVPIA